MRISEQTAITYQYRNNWHVFITEADSVDCAGPTECLSVFQVILISQHSTNKLHSTFP